MVQVDAVAGGGHSRDGTLLKFVHHSLWLPMPLLSLVLQLHYSHSYYLANNFHSIVHLSVSVFVVVAVHSFSY